MTQKSGNSALRIPHSPLADWLPNMDLNHDKQIQSLLCYHYTIRQAFGRYESSHFQPPVKPNAFRSTAKPQRTQRGVNRPFHALRSLRLCGGFASS